MSLRTASLAFAFALAIGLPQAEAFDRTGYKIPVAVQALVTHDRSKINLSNEREAKLFLAYSLGFGASLEGEWTGEFSRNFGKRAFDKLSRLLVAAADPVLNQAAFAGVDDAKTFAARADRRGQEGRSAIAFVSAIAGD